MKVGRKNEPIQIILAKQPAALVAGHEMASIDCFSDLLYGPRLYWLCQVCCRAGSHPHVLGLGIPNPAISLYEFRASSWAGQLAAAGGALLDPGPDVLYSLISIGVDIQRADAGLQIMAH